jgi:hypothetical protein
MANERILHSRESGERMQPTAQAVGLHVAKVSKPQRGGRNKLVAFRTICSFLRLESEA